MGFPDDYGSFDDINYNTSITQSNQPLSNTIYNPDDINYNPDEFITQYEYAFCFHVGGIRQTLHKPTDSIQIHTIQNFEPF